MVTYHSPKHWINYQRSELFGALTDAKAAVLSLVSLPFQRSWVEALQVVQLKLEVAGTSKIEGADFTDRELELALRQSPEELLTRSQKQAHAAMLTYKWIRDLPKDRPIDIDLIKHVHRLIITGADDDHCAPGQTRERGQNVTFGIPKHRGCEGGPECDRTLEELGKAIRGPYKEHDPLIQALAMHYHFAAMHPFEDGNGRTARAVEALMLRTAGLTDHLFIAMSNYYYDEKTHYLQALSAVQPPEYDLTPFLQFGLRGIKVQCDRLFSQIQYHVKGSIFKNTMYDLYDRLETTRKRVIKNRHIGVLKILLEAQGPVALGDLITKSYPMYSGLKAGRKAQLRDLFHLLDLDAMRFKDNGTPEKPVIEFMVNLDWPKQITENGFLEKVKNLPKVKSSLPF